MKKKEKIKKLCIDGLQTDGGHHKQWYLEKILKKVISKKKINYLMNNEYWEKGEVKGFWRAKVEEYESKWQPAPEPQEFPHVEFEDTTGINANYEKEHAQWLKEISDGTVQAIIKQI